MYLAAPVLPTTAFDPYAPDDFWPDAPDAEPPSGEGAHVIVCGPGAIDELCRLLRRGAASVTLLRPGERPEAASANLLIATRVGTAEQAAMLAAHAARALLPGGQVCVGLHRAGHGDAVLPALRTALRQRGFAPLRVFVDTEGLTVVARRKPGGPTGDGRGG